MGSTNVFSKHFVTTRKGMELNKTRVGGQNEQVNGLTAVQSNKAAFKNLIPYLPDDWRQRMKIEYPYYATDKGNTRLNHMRSLHAAPSLEELKFLEKICAKG